MTEKRAALIIASYEYQDPELRQLVAPAQDAETLTRVLQDPDIGGFEVETLLNEPSYKVNQAIEGFFADRKRDDLLLLYFSCHGVKDEDGQLYFATASTQRKLLRSTAVWANFVNGEMRRCRSRRQVLLLDCCYSGAFAKGMLAKANRDIGTAERFEGRGRVVLTASDAMQYAFEEDKVEGENARSIFTRILVHGLEAGEADLNGDGRISLDELYEYVHDQMMDEAPQQRPGKWDFGVQGKIVIAQNPHPVTRPTILSHELQQAIGSPLAGVREATVSELERLLWSSDKGVVLAAREALARLANDDNHQVSVSAAHAQRHEHEVLNLDRIIWKQDGKEMVRVPAGKFHYGDKKGECELPEFWIDKAPVTNAEYAHFVVATGHKPPRHWEGKAPPKQIADHPVVYVTWRDAVAYAEWAGKRLPTEEEWEKAARGIDGWEYPWGDWEEGRCNTSEAGIGTTTPVGQYSPLSDSPYGCVDMAGNAFEWASPEGGEKGYVLRGGSWGRNRDRACCAYRTWLYPGSSERDPAGFRCVSPVS